MSDFKINQMKNRNRLHVDKQLRHIKYAYDIVIKYILKPVDQVKKIIIYHEVTY